jgi:hypothetical protein
LTPYDLTRHLNTNAKAGFGNLADPMKVALGRMLQNMPPHLRDSLIISDTGRNWQMQVEAAKRHGLDPRVGKPGVLAPWGRGKHHGSAATAVDFYKPRPDALRWMRENAKQYGLAFPIPADPWHMEYRGGAAPVSAPESPAQGGPSGVVAAAGPTPPPAAQGSFRGAQEAGMGPQTQALAAALTGSQGRDPVIAQLLKGWTYGAA